MAKNNSQNEQLESFIRYLSDRMEPIERNQFERIMQRDPFEAEALEGFSTLPLKTALNDLGSISIFKSKRPWGKIIKKTVVAISAVAALAFVTFLGIRYLPGLVQEVKLFTQVTKVTPPEKKPVLSQSATPDQSVSPPQMLVDSTDTNQLIVLSPKDIGVQSITIEKMAPPVPVKAAKAVRRTTTNNPIEPLRPVEWSPAVSDQPRKQQLTLGQEKKDEDREGQAQLELPVATETLQKVEPESSDSRSGSGLDAEPEPIGGSKLYRSYLDSNCRFPKEAGSNSKETVRLKFKVSTNGNPREIVITRSPGPAFSNEAIRLVVEGPRWSPAVKDGKPVEGEVNLKINFKP